MEKSDQQHTLILANQLGELETIRASLDSLVKAWGIPASMEFSLNLALEEAFTNVVNYAFDDGKEHKIELGFKKQEGNLVITITDDGQPYDPTQTPEPDTGLDVRKRPIGGLGIFLVKKFMDKVEYRRIDNKNQLILTKNLAI
jgi:anti-sigma regulatory factor (Ser/Thr protein kinase)